MNPKTVTTLRRVGIALAVIVAVAPEKARVPIVMPTDRAALEAENAAMRALIEKIRQGLRMGLDVLMKSNYMNISIFIAILFAILSWVILSKTTFGYELKACGFNQNASKYAGIRQIALTAISVENEKRNRLAARQKIT